MLSDVLGSQGYEVRTADSGGAALEILTTAVPDLVLLDLVMPAPDGFAVLRAIRGNPATADLPVIALTALEREADVAHAFECGADDLVQKPFREAELLARIRVHLRFRDTVAELAKNERDARILLEVAQTLASSQSYRDILRQVVRRIAEVVRVDRCSIVLARSGDTIGHVVASSDVDGDLTLPLDLRKYPEIRAVLQSGAPLLITDTASDPILGGVRDEGGRMPFASHLLFPVRHQAETIAILSLRTSTRRDQLTDHEIHFCQLVASSMAFSLQSARALAALRSETEQTASAVREAQARLETLERYADFFNSAADGILVIDEKGKILFANPRATLVLGQPITSVVGHSLVEFAPPQGQERLRSLVVTWTAGEFPAADLDVIAADGSARVLAVTANALLSSERATLLTVRDVTSERHMQAELQHTKDFLEKLIASSVDAIVAADVRGLVILFNPGAERIYGYRAEDVVGRMSVKALYPQGFAQEVMRRLRSPQFGGVGKLEQMRAEVLDSTGERMPIALSAALIYESGEEVASFGIFTDLRDKLRIEERLAAAQRKLEISEKQAIVAELAGTAAHELNQPLTSVMGYAEMLKRKLDRDSPHYRAADIIVREAERMAEVVRKIGKITRYETQSYVGRAQILDLGRASGEDRSTPVVPEPKGHVAEKEKEEEKS